MEKTVSYLKAYFDKTNIPMQTRHKYCMHCSDVNALYNHLPFMFLERFVSPLIMGWQRATGRQKPKSE